MLITLRRIMQEVSAATRLEEALAIVVRRVKQSIPIDACSVYLTDAESDQYVLMAADGLNPASIGQVRLGRHEGLVGLVGERQEPVNLKDAAAHPRYCYSPHTGEECYHAFLGVPLIYYRRVVGVLVARQRVQCQFDKEAVAFFITLAAQLAKAIYDAAAIAGVNQLLSGEVHENVLIQGIGGAPGVAIGTIVLIDPLATLELIPDRQAQDIAAEEAGFRGAVAAVDEELRFSSARLAAVLIDETRALLDVYRMLLGSNSLISDTLQRIRAGSWAPGAWRDTIVEHARVFEHMEDPYLRARAEDIRALGRRILNHLQPQAPESRQYPERCILVGETVSIMEIAAVPMERLAGIVCRRGSALSHTAVLAHALGIPAVVSLTALPVRGLDGGEIVVDGDQGRIYIQPSHAVLDVFQRRINEEEALSARLKTLRDLPAETPDGVRLALYANIGLTADLTPALTRGAEGVGVYRTEFAFLVREAFPAEEEQYQLYREALEAFAPKPVNLRTLDVGGDKILPYFPLEETNPFLGCRGIRFTLAHPEIFLIQLRAMLRANAGLNNLHVLLPMVSRVSEVEETLGLLARAYHELLEDGQAVVKPPVGVMIEVPSAAYLVSALAKRVEFFSVGTNDLIQYLLAVDRTNAEVVTPYDSLHPAVLNLICQVIDEAHRCSRPVSVCGEMAGDPMAALLLLGMGVDALSMNPTSLSRIKWVIRSFPQERARVLLAEALGLEDGFAIYRLLHGALAEAGLGVLVRAA